MRRLKVKVVNPENPLSRKGRQKLKKQAKSRVGPFGKWRSFLKKHSGEGYTRKQLSKLYHGKGKVKKTVKRTTKPKKVSKPVKKAVSKPRPKNGRRRKVKAGRVAATKNKWIAFQKSMKGQGYTRKQLKTMYGGPKDSPASSPAVKASLAGDMDEQAWSLAGKKKNARRRKVKRVKRVKRRNPAVKALPRLPALARHRKSRQHLVPAGSYIVGPYTVHKKGVKPRTFYPHAAIYSHKKRKAVRRLKNPFAFGEIKASVLDFFNVEGEPVTYALGLGSGIAAASLTGKMVNRLGWKLRQYKGIARCGAQTLVSVAFIVAAKKTSGKAKVFCKGAAATAVGVTIVDIVCTAIQMIRQRTWRSPVHKVMERAVSGFPAFAEEGTEGVFVGASPFSDGETFDVTGIEDVPELLGYTILEGLGMGETIDEASYNGYVGWVNGEDDVEGEEEIDSVDSVDSVTGM